MNRYHEYFNVLIILVILVVFLFYNFINGEYVFASGDTLAPKAIKNSLQSISKENGYFPYWYPYIFSGMPTVHSLLNINEFYFPHKIFKFFHGLGLAWIWNFLFHYLFAAIGMYSLLRFFKQSKRSSILSAILFSLSPYMVAYLVHGHGSQVMTASYIPIIFLFLFKIHKKINIVNFVSLALLIGLQLQRGHIQIAYYTWMMMGIFILFSFLYNYKNDLKKSISYAVSSLLSLLTGFLLSISIYYPILNYTSYSVRGADQGGYGLQNATQWSLNLKEFITFIMPYSYGFGGQNYWGYLPFTDFPNYIGFFIIFLAFIGFFYSNIEKEYKMFFISALFLSLFLSLGKYFQNFYQIFYYYLPFFNKFRAPVFILVISQFCIYVLAGFGLGVLPELLKCKLNKFKIFFGFSLMIFIVLFYSFYESALYPEYRLAGTEKDFLNKVKQTYQQLLLNKDLNNDALYNGVDKEILNKWTETDAKLYYSYLKLTQSKSIDNELIPILYSTSSHIDKVQNFINKNKIILLVVLCLLISFSFLYSYYTFLSTKLFIFIIILIISYDYYRVNSDIINPRYHFPHKNIVQHKSFIDDYLEQDELIKFLSSDSSQFRVLDLTGNNSNRLAAFNIQTISGYHPAKLETYDKILKIINNKGYYPYGLLQMLNVKYIIHSQNGNIPNFSKLDSKFLYRYYGNNLASNEYVESYIYENNNLLKRIFFVENITFLDDNNQILSKVTDDSFNPKINSYININNLSDEQTNTIKNIKYDAMSKVDLISWEPDRIIFKIKTKSPQFILLSEIDYPGWTINNNIIININGLFRGLIVPEGEHQYIMEFKPTDIYIGKLISGFLYLLLIILIFFNLFKTKIKNV
ncbi:MAG: hypothetical protein CMG66_04170 [Candidatus Marinimicrobia bacterium]|nr:hypothetical protein [Candidatus Neomarinimicrobiota bacterium]|tara:strand:+ start:7801 stop:10383 length:2583 start_codon:yes stop_codon:yes gene_type:complete